AAEALPRGLPPVQRGLARATGFRPRAAERGDRFTSVSKWTRARARKVSRISCPPTALARNRRRPTNRQSTRSRAAPVREARARKSAASNYLARTARAADADNRQTIGRRRNQQGPGRFGAGRWFAGYR